MAIGRTAIGLVARASIVAFVWASSPVRAQTPPPQTRHWTTDQLVAQALSANPELRVRKWDTTAADADIKTAKAWPNPAIRFEWLHAQERSDGMGWGVGLQWTPPQPVEWSARQSQAEARKRAVEE